MNRPEPTPKTVFIKTYGCQMNVYDSERMTEVLAREGYTASDTPDDADLIIMNTCHIREKAVEKVYSELGKFRVLKERRKRDGRAMQIAVAGCVAQAEGTEMTRRESAIDLVFGPQTYHRLPELLKQRAETGRAVVETEFPADDKFDAMVAQSARKPLSKSVAAFLTVQEGCDKFCTFCVVPYTRGAEFSRPMADVVAEAEAMVRNGVKEITLLGQNVNAYHGDGSRLATLIDRLSRIEDLARIRYMTSHPRNMSDDLIAVHAENGKLMPYLHLPVQAGSDRVLKAMNRGHTASDYIKLIERVRKARPDIAISGDFIVGFPGETDQEFEETLALVREVKYASAFSFKYSPRPGTPAAELKEQVADDVQAERLSRLQVLLGSQLQAFNASCVGKTFQVLIEKPGRNEGQVIGRSPYLQSVHFESGAHRVGDMVKVQITGVKPNSLSGSVTDLQHPQSRI
jgi:tRNA-2-methylthio-N6-dimethylallyladenosine synthase